MSIWGLAADLRPPSLKLSDNVLRQTWKVCFRIGKAYHLDSINQLYTSLPCRAPETPPPSDEFFLQTQCFWGASQVRLRCYGGASGRFWNTNFSRDKGHSAREELWCFTYNRSVEGTTRIDSAHETPTSPMSFLSQAHCVGGAPELRRMCVWGASELRRRCVWGASEVRRRCVWEAK